MQASRFILTLLCFILISFYSRGNTISPITTDIPNRIQIQNRLDTLNSRKSLTTNERATQQNLLNTLTLLDDIDEVNQQIQNLKKQVNEAPNKIKVAVQQLEELRKNNAAHSDNAYLKQQQFIQLESQVSAVQQHIQIAQEQLSTYSGQLINLQTQPEGIQNNLYTEAERIHEIRNQLNDLSDDFPIRNALRDRLKAELALYTLRMDFQRKQLDSNTILQDVLQKQRDYTTQYIVQQELLLKNLQNAISDKRLTFSENIIKDSESIKKNTSGATLEEPLINQASTANELLSKKLIQSTENVNILLQDNIIIKNRLEYAQRTERNLKEQISSLKGTILLSRILYQHQQNLPDTQEVNNVNNKIADLRLEQFDINQQRDTLFQGTTLLQKLGIKGIEPTDKTTTALLSTLVEIRKDLLDRLNKQLGDELSLAINLQINQQQLINTNSSLQRILKQQIFWVNSNRAIDINWLKSFPTTAKTELQTLFTQSYKLNQRSIDWFGFAFIPFALIVMVSIVIRKYVSSHLQIINSEIGKLKKDSQHHTPLAILLTALKSVPGVLTILLIGYIFLVADLPLGSFVWVLSKKLALAWFAVYLILRLLMPVGVYIKHFMLLPESAAYYRKKTLLVSVFLIPLIIWSVIGQRYPLFLVNDVIGQLLISIILFALSIIILPICYNVWVTRKIYSIRLIIVILVSVMPLIMLILLLLGYFYTTLMLANNWIDTLYLILFWNIVYSSVVRGLSVAAKRLQYRRALQRKQDMQTEDAEGNQLILEEKPLNVEQINQQTLRLITMLLLFIFAFFFIGIWSEIFTVFSYLNNFSLWHYSAKTAVGDVIQAVTLGNFLFAILMLIVTFILVRNLPGLLEVFILSKLRLRQGTSYAFTTILNYLIVVLGGIVALGILGVSWDKLQWLVAALSLGLGFGLQEIFANFVSGLIILFERPIRIGDTITLGTYSGTVSRIRIRATTIRDFDKKEVIVPNKAFVTERLINWSLTDTVTRIIIKIGFAYGTDLAKAKELLLIAAKANPRVMSEPEPQVYFLEFADSTLQHELRVYVSEVKDRSYAVDELNRKIDELCRKHNIEMAFNQLDVHLYKAGNQ